ncbi:MAG: peptidylprolyl isomerase [Acaryochloris sp. RU_4_1]|nr:peptidylprolyl isomerase [Acaryochloris sp. RU_4_1]NJR54626.1 peptidylprolyl isomerase [Acaryochloris sp. CRU_2_0]
MTAVLHRPQTQLDTQPLLTKLAQYQLLPHLIKELILDEAIADIPLSASAVETAIAQFCQSQRLDSAETKQAWLTHFHMSETQLETQAIRLAKLEQLKQERWGNQVEPLFLAQKQHFDQVTYSLLRTDSSDIAQELFFRLKDGEQTFAQLVSDYSQGPEVQTGGRVGPIEVARLHPILAQLLMRAQPGKICPPTKLEQWVVIVRLEELTSAVLDDSLRQRLLDHLFQEWLQQQLAEFDRASLANFA